jgi:hypothetical protein
VSSLLADLSSLATRLNAASDSINDIIKRFEATLQSFNLGLEVWVYGDGLSDPDEVDLEADPPHEEQDAELGFCRHGAEWLLCLRDTTCQVREHPEHYCREWKVIRAGEPRPLLKAARADRLAALLRFPVLLRALKHAAEQSLKTIEEAKTFVEQC